jgi:hypothetical protein
LLLKTLVFWGDAPLARARERQAPDTTLLLWGRPSVEGSSTTFRSADLNPAQALRIETEAASWAAAFGDKPLLEGRSFAELYRWKDEPLWPAAHAALSASTSASSGCLRLIGTFDFFFETELPDEVEAFGLPADEARLLERCATARGVLFQGKVPGPPARPLAAHGGPGLLGAAFRALRSAGERGRMAKVPPGVVFVRPEGTDAARSEAFERLIASAREELSQPCLVVGGNDGPAPEILLDRTGRAAAGEADKVFERALTELVDTPAVADAFRHHRVGFADLAAVSDLGLIFGNALPRSVRRYEACASLVREGKVLAVCALREDSLPLAAARAAGIPAEPLTDPGDGARVLQALRQALGAGGMVG